MAVGIDDIALYVTPLMISTDALKVGRALTDKTINEAGFEARSIVPCYEDVVTQAVNAARSIISGHESDYNLLIVGTESGFDFGKPISGYIHRYLNLPSTCSNFEIKHACYSGTAALKMACAWVAQLDNAKKALVIMSDVGRAHLNHPTEITGGSAAIAISVSKNPKILELNLVSGCAASEVFDVARPTQTFEYSDPGLSLASYLDLAEMASNNFNQLHKIKDLQQHFSYMLYHTPLLSLIKEAHITVMQQATTLDLNAIDADFKQRVLPSFSLNALTGNIFSASLYNALLGLLTDLNTTPTQPISLFSYGSGACGEFYEGKLCKDSINIIKNKQLRSMLLNRYSLDIATYEKLVAEQEHIAMAADYKPDYNQVPQVYEEFYANKNILILDKIEKYHRLYTFS